jgi:hypothetical protein
MTGLLVGSNSREESAEAVLLVSSFVGWCSIALVSGDKPDLRSFSNQYDAELPAECAFHRCVAATWPFTGAEVRVLHDGPQGKNRVLVSGDGNPLRQGEVTEIGVALFPKGRAVRMDGVELCIHLADRSVSADTFSVQSDPVWSAHWKNGRRFRTTSRGLAWHAAPINELRGVIRVSIVLPVDFLAQWGACTLRELGALRFLSVGELLLAEDLAQLPLIGARFNRENTNPAACSICRATLREMIW